MRRIIVCGFGFMGQNHAANILRCPDLELAAVVDPVPKSAVRPVRGNQNTSGPDPEKLRDIPFFSELSRALEQCPADAVLIATPVRFHARAALEAAAAGKHVFVEKPLCFSLEEGAELQEALREKKLTFQVGHNLRFQKMYRVLRQFVREGTCGKLKALKLHRLTGTPDWGAWRELDVSLTSLSGPLFDLDIHDFDFALSLLGEPARMTAERMPGTDALFRTVWSYPGKCEVLIEGGFTRPSALPFRCGFAAVFERAVLEYDSRLGEKILLAGEDGCSAIDCTSPDSSYYEELLAFSSAMHRGTPVQCGLAEGLRALEICFRLKALLEK